MAQDQELYGAAPLLPHESDERYSQIHSLLKPGFGGHLSRFEYSLEKEMADSVLMEQRWDQAEAALTNRAGRQLMEGEGPSTLIDFASLLTATSADALRFTGATSPIRHRRNSKHHHRSGPWRW